MIQDARTDRYEVRAAREVDVRWAAALAATVYQGFDVISESTMVEWFHANPSGFFTFWFDDNRVGNFELLPLRPEAMRRFVAGQVLEKDLGGDCLFTPCETAEIHELYWESIVLDPDFTGSRMLMLKAFVLAYPDLLAKVCALDQLRHVYAIAASRKGAGVLRRMGFCQTGDASCRLDGHPLYCGTLHTYEAAVRDLFPRAPGRVDPQPSTR